MVPRRPLTGLQTSTFQSSSLSNSIPAPNSSISSPYQSRPMLRETDAGPEWTVQEDWSLHQAVTNVQELSLSTMSSSAGHIVNWDMVSDMVNAVSSCYRS